MIFFMEISFYLTKCVQKCKVYPRALRNACPDGRTPSGKVYVTDEERDNRGREYDHIDGEKGIRRDCHG